MDKKILIYHGPEKSHFKAYCEKVVKEKFFQIPKKPNIKIHEFYGNQMGNEEYLNEFRLSISCDSIFTESNVKDIFILWDYDKFFNVKFFSKLFQEISDDYYFFLYSREKKKLGALEKKLSKKSIIIEKKFVDQAHLKNKIELFFQEKNLLEDEVIQYLLEHFLENVELIDKELEKIALHFYKEKITLDGVKNVVVDSYSEKEIYKLIDIFFSRNLKRIIKELNIYFSRPVDFNYYIALMIKEVFLVLSFVELKEKSKNELAIFDELGVRYPFQKKNLVKRSAIYSRHELSFLLKGFLYLEVLNKTSSYSKTYSYKGINYQALHFLLKIILYVF